MNDKEFIKKLIDIRHECENSDCSECHYAIGYGHNCCLNGIPCEWNDLEELLKAESEVK